MDRTRKTALLTGLLFAVTIAAAIPGALLYTPILTDPGYITGPGADGQIALGALFEILVCIANIGTAVVLFPLVRRQNEAVALGYVASRIAESVLIAVGILSVLSVVTLRQQYAGGSEADAGAFLVAGEALVALHGWTFLLGPGLLAGFGNGLLLGYLLYRSGLVPRPMALVGLIGGPVVFVSGIAVLFGAYEQTSVWSGLLTLPEIVWESFLAIYLTFHGFRPSPITASSHSGDGRPVPQSA
ncbi:DUF4386 domain-containing protein [Naasia sp. SYSU D00057]|uniref:DUF4386 domain-containing protein n=1 Tax=Naasia sp. SYSU D00057 TaxID=2817380 RepID=UPI001B3181B5|nr:DUF4386 domain-containing protein [Naasia sp. SYSU D00057]